LFINKIRFSRNIEVLNISKNKVTEVIGESERSKYKTAGSYMLAVEFGIASINR
jgi:hypothetical protein